MQGLRISARKVAGLLAAMAVLYFGLGALLHYVVFPEKEPPEWAYAKPGFTFETPTGERIQLIRGANETRGEFAEVHFDVAPGGYAARAHIHPHQEERFEVLSGSLTALVGEKEKLVSAGETLVVPAGTPHQPFNRGGVEMRSIARITPPGKLGLFFGQMSGLDFKPTLLQMMLFVQVYEVYPVSPPPAVVRVMSFLLAPTARARVMRKFDYELFADYFQFYLQDESAEGNLGENWTEEAVARLLAVAPGTVGVGTVRNMNVPVTVEVLDAEPDSELESWDHATECSLEVPTGRIVIAGCTDYLPDAARIEVEPGAYRVRISYGSLDTLSEDRLDGDDRYRVQLWKAPLIEPRVIKQRAA